MPKTKTLEVTLPLSVTDGLFMRTFLAEASDSYENTWDLSVTGAHLLVTVKRVDREPVQMLLPMEEIFRQSLLALNDSERDR